MSLCPNCLEKNISSPLVIIGIKEQIRMCDNDDCIYIEKKNSINFESIPNKKSIKSENNLEYFEPSISSSDSEKSIKKQKIDINEYEFSTTLRHFQSLLNNLIIADNDLFNWFCLPLMLKFHSKFCYFLIIHLNIFDYKKNFFIKNIKEKYYKAESIVRNVPRKLISLMSYDFIKFLFDEHNIFNLSKIHVLNMSERILRSLRNFIENLENKDIYKIIYSYNGSCNSCNNVIKYIKEDISIKLLKDYEYNNNSFVYVSQCKKCLGAFKVTINIQKLSNFLILDVPDGISCDFKRLMSTSMCPITGEEIHLQAVIEFSSVDFEDIPEKIPTINEFIFKKCMKQKIQYRIHFRNTDGWYYIDNKSGLTVKNLYGKNVNIILSNVRLLIYGHCNNPSEIKSAISEISLYEELKQYKNLLGYVEHPHNEIKYWLYLFKYRDFYRNTPLMSKHIILNIVTRINTQLNNRLCRKRHFNTNVDTDDEFSELMNKEKLYEESNINLDDDENYSMGLVKYKDFIADTEPKINCDHSKSDIILNNFDEAIYTDDSLSSHLKTPQVKFEIDHLIETKKARIRKKTKII